MYQLLQESHLLPTPLGAYQTVCTPTMGPARQLLLALLVQEQTQVATPEMLQAWSGMDSPEAALELLFRLQDMGLVQGLESPQTAPSGPLQEVLPELIPQLSSSGKALVADNQGLYVATSGFTHEAAEELSALGADLSMLYARHQGLLQRNMGFRQQAWGLVDAAGNSAVGFWPMHIGDTEFMLILGDMPRLNQAAFLNVVWGLCCRYARPR